MSQSRSFILKNGVFPARVLQTVHTNLIRYRIPLAVKLEEYGPVIGPGFGKGLIPELDDPVAIVPDLPNLVYHPEFKLCHAPLMFKACQSFVDEYSLDNISFGA